MTKNGNGKRHASPQSLNGAVKAICDIMRRSNGAEAILAEDVIKEARRQLHEARRLPPTGRGRTH